MNLHYNKEIFEELIVAASNELGIPTNIIEKDYYVTIILKALSEKISDMVFKGGTSLTKCYHILDRFSEDIDLAERYDLMPFDITTQTIERTLVDKVFAICDYYLQGKIENHSRHLYDIYKIFNVLNDTEQLTNLIPEVRAVRSRLSICPSANDGVSVTNILNEIIENQVYRNDYDNITMGLLFIPENYDTVIQGIKQIVENGIWN